MWGRQVWGRRNMCSPGAALPKSTAGSTSSVYTDQRAPATLIGVRGDAGAACAGFGRTVASETEAPSL